MVRRGEWGDEDRRGSAGRWGWGRNDADVAPARSAQTAGEQEEYRGLLSVAVEFLFGPEPFHPGPDDADRWKLRGRAVVALSVSSAMEEKGGGVALSDLVPYVDRPTSSLDDAAGINAEGLRIVSHFNGKPASSSQKDPKEEARFVFPELMAEAESGDLFGPPSKRTVADYDSAENLLFVRTSSLLSLSAPEGGRTLGSPVSTVDDDDSAHPPPQLYLRERRHVLTKLDQSQFGRCCLLGFLNAVGVRWLSSSVRRGGLLYIRNATLFGAADGLLGVLRFYSVLFLALPLGRLGVISLLNRGVEERNRRRRGVAEELAKREVGQVLL